MGVMVSMAKAKSRSLTSRLARWRLWVQAAFLLAWMDPLMLRLHTFCGPVFHCYSCPLATLACPIGVLANFSALHVFPYVAFGMLLGAGAVFGSLVCGWMCPFGLLQDLVGRIPLPKFSLPSWTGYLRYAVLLGLVLAVPYLYGEAHPLFFCRLCPAGAVEAAMPYTAQTAAAGAVVWPSTLKVTILVLFVAAMLFTWRPWCATLCPLGAIYGLCNYFSLFYMRFHADRCRQCASCRNPCLGGGGPEGRADDARCVRCLECSGCNAVTIGTIWS